MQYHQARKLLQKYRKGKCSPQETAILEDAYENFQAGAPELSPERIQQLSAQILENLPCNRAVKPIRLWTIILTAAAATLLTLSTWFYYHKDPQMPLAAVNDIPPGSNRATLTLPGGKTITLKSTKTGLTITAGDITYSDGTKISPDSATSALASKQPTSSIAGGEAFSTITIPKGGQYQITLADGTRVWLNAASMLRFPASFSGLAKRQVDLSGEAYFEVAKDKTRPFMVNTAGQQVRVLGTHFNIEAYELENTKTTLLEGSVKVSRLAGSPQKAIILTPGQQARYLSGKLTASPVDARLFVAWKTGKTVFKDAELNSIMAALERWYNIQVVYENYPTESRFSGSVSRLRNISEVLNLIESTGEVHFKIIGRKVLVMK